MMLTENQQTDTKNKPEKAGILNGIIPIVSKAFVLIWAGLSALWTRPFMEEHYQKMANSHYDSMGRWFEMGPVFIAALVFSIHSFIHKRFFVGVLTVIIAIWAFYWAFMVSFSCYDCTYGG